MTNSKKIRSPRLARTQKVFHNKSQSCMCAFVRCTFHLCSGVAVWLWLNLSSTQCFVRGKNILSFRLNLFASSSFQDSCTQRHTEAHARTRDTVVGSPHRWRIEFSVSFSLCREHDDGGPFDSKLDDISCVAQRSTNVRNGAHLRTIDIKRN